MADRTGVGKALVQHIWDELGLAPHRLETFKASNDLRFAEN
jgi:hypothetical protein